MFQRNSERGAGVATRDFPNPSLAAQLNSVQPAAAAGTGSAGLNLDKRDFGIIRAGRLAAISRGELVPTQVHPCIAQEEAVLEIENFCLWYGLKRALHNIGMAIPKGKV